nr:MAG TPA: hypothetical protein [Caudoviricetes sp.]
MGYRLFSRKDTHERLYVLSHIHPTLAHLLQDS